MKHTQKLAIGLTVFFTAVFGILVYWLAQRIAGGTGLFATILLVVLSLIVALVMTGVLRSTGVVKTAGYTYTGAAAIFFGTFSTSYAAYLKAPEERWVIDLTLVDFPHDATGGIRVNNGCAVDFGQEATDVKLDVHGECRAEQLTFTVTANGMEPFYVGPEPAAELRQKGARIKWAGVPEKKFFGTVVSNQTKAPLEGVKVFLRDCIQLQPVTTSGTGAFNFGSIPSDCLGSTQVGVSLAGHTEFHPIKRDEAANVEIDGAVITSVTVGDGLFFKVAVSDPGGAGIYALGSHGTEAPTFLWSTNGDQAIRTSVTGKDQDAVGLRGQPARLRLLTPAEVHQALAGRIAALKPAELELLSAWLDDGGPSGIEARTAITEHCSARSQQVVTRILDERNPADAPDFCARFGELDAWSGCGKGVATATQRRLRTTRGLYCP